MSFFFSTINSFIIKSIYLNNKQKYFYTQVTVEMFELKNEIFSL